MERKQETKRSASSSPWATVPWAVAGALAAGATLASRKRNQSRWLDQVVFITGGSRGLGFILARRLAAKGARVAFCARDAQEIQRAVDAIVSATRERMGERAHERVRGIRCDVGNPDELRSAIRQVTEDWGPIDVLVNNASIIQVGPFETMAEKEYREALAVNFWPLVHSTLELIPEMKSRGHGRIVNITSIGGVVPVPHLLPYVSAKFAAFGFSQALQIEAARHGVRVTTIVPGLMRTGSFLNALFKGDQESEFRWFSLGSTVPVASMDAERAARRIIRACERGERLVTLGAPAKAMRLSYALLPGLVTATASLVNRFLLPNTGKGAGAEKYAKPGYLYRTKLSSAPFTFLGDRAAEKFNQKAG